MIKKIKNFICNLFSIKQCACEDSAEPETPMYTDVDGKAVKCGTHNRYKKSCPICKEIAGIV
jgi:hypothetical protein